MIQQGWAGRRAWRGAPNFFIGVVQLQPNPPGFREVDAGCSPKANGRAFCCRMTPADLLQTAEENISSKSIYWARFCIASSAAAITGSLLIAAFLYYRDNPFVAGELAVSTLQSPRKNPSGFLIASAGPLVGAALLAPLVPLFYGRFRSSAPFSATIGAGTLMFSVLAFCTNGILSLHSYTGRHHADLATVSFACAVLAVLSLLHAARRHNLELGRERLPAIDVLLWLNFSSLLMLLTFFVGPDYFGLINPLELVGVNPWHIIGVSELLFTVLAFGSLLLLISVAELGSRPSADT